MSASATLTRTFSLSSCDWIGFDLDHTLIRYRLFEFHQLIYQSMCEYLVHTFHYNSSLLQIPYDDSFGVKGLIYDNRNGNLIQLNAHGVVHTALHGVHRHLSSDEIKQIYPNALEAIEEDTSQRFLCIFTYFEHSTSYLIAHIIDLIDRGDLCQDPIDVDKKYSFFLVHFSQGFDHLFNDFNRGNYFQSIRDNPEKYIYQRADVRQWLEKLKAKNQRLFLATNSRLDYTDLLSTYAFGEDWRSLFDLIIVDCKKPSFFSSPENPNKRSFHRSNENNQLLPVTIEEIKTDFQKHFIYTQGNSADLHQLMGEISDKDPLVIYFGDHIKSDINALKRQTNWLAAVVVEELEFDSPPLTVQTTTHRLTHPSVTTAATYATGQRSKYFSSFFTSPSDLLVAGADGIETTKFDQTEPDAVLPSLSSYWFTYITKHAHLSLSCLSVLANANDSDRHFEHGQQTEHFILRHQNQ